MFFGVFHIDLRLHKSKPRDVGRGIAAIHLVCFVICVSEIPCYSSGLIDKHHCCCGCMQSAADKLGRRGWIGRTSSWRLDPLLVFRKTLCSENPCKWTDKVGKAGVDGRGEANFWTDGS